MIFMEVCKRVRASGLEHNRRPFLRLSAALSKEEVSLTYHTDRYRDVDLESDSDMDDDTYMDIVRDRLTRRISEKYEKLHAHVDDTNTPNYALMDEITWLMFEQEFNLEPSDSPREYEEFEVEFLKRLEMRNRSEACNPYHACVQKKTKSKHMKLGDWAMIKNKVFHLLPHMEVRCMQLDESGNLAWSTKRLKPLKTTLDFKKTKMKCELLRAHPNGTFSPTSDLDSPGQPVMTWYTNPSTFHDKWTMLQQRHRSPRGIPSDQLKKEDLQPNPVEFQLHNLSVHQLTSNLKDKVPFVIRMTAELTRLKTHDLLKGAKVPESHKTVFVADTQPFWVVSKMSSVDHAYSLGGGPLARQLQFATMRELRAIEMQEDAES
jgi:hypothetical protein